MTNNIQAFLIRRILLSVSCLLFVALVESVSPVVAMEPLCFDAERVTWSELQLKASKWGLTSTSTVTIEPIPALKAEKEFVGANEMGGLHPGVDDEVLFLKITSSVLGRDLTSSLWLDPLHAVAFQEIQQTLGRRHRYRAYRFLDEGVYSLLRRPGDGEAGLETERWSDVSDSRIPHPPWAGERLVVAGPSSIFYLVSVAGLTKPGDHIEIPVFARDHTELLKLRVEEVMRPRVNYREVSLSGEKRVKGRVEALRISLRSRPLDDNAESDFQVIGLKGDVEILIDRTTRVPLEIRGRIPYAGNVRVRLQRVVLR